MRINNNLMAMNTFRQYSINNANAAASTEKLSSGYRINRAGDDAAGLAISEKMRAQIRGLDMASKNSQDAISLVQTAEGALTETHSILQRMNELAVQSASDTNNDAVDREALQSEFSQLTSEINDIASKTTFNKKNLLDGTFGKNASAVLADTTTVGELKTAVKVSGGLSITSTGAGMKDDTYGITFTAAASATPDTFTLTGSGGDKYTIMAGKKDEAATFAAGTSYKILDSSDNEVGTMMFSADALATLGDTNVPSGGKSPQAIALADVKVKVGGTEAKFQTGANAGETTSVSIGSMKAEDLGITSAVSIDTQEKASAAITAVNNAINKVSTQRSQLGAIQNRLQHKINNLNTSSENLTAAESRIRDLDMAKEMTNYTKNNILVQASTAMLAQANSAPQGVLQLLK